MKKDVTSYLANGETILSEYRYKKYHYYATDRRLIVFFKGNFSDVAYKHITTINYYYNNREELFYLGIVLFIIGLFVTLSILIVLGIIFIVLSIVLRIKRYTINTSGGESLLFPVKKQKDAENFLKILREKMFEQKP
jgi:hypothetical protein